MVAIGLGPTCKVIPVGGQPMLIIPPLPLAKLNHRAIPIGREEVPSQQPAPLDIGPVSGERLIGSHPGVLDSPGRVHMVAPAIEEGGASRVLLVIALIVEWDG
jgi:hypothetical protein